MDPVIVSILAIILGVLFFFIILGTIIGLVKRKLMLGSSWEGEVINKTSGMTGYTAGGTIMMNNSYVLMVKTNNNQEKRVGVTQGIYEQFKIGDKITKKIGELYPKKG